MHSFAISHVVISKVCFLTVDYILQDNNVFLVYHKEQHPLGSEFTKDKLLQNK